MGGRVEQHDTVTVVEDLVADDPGKACLNPEDPLSSTLRDLIVQDDRVTRLLTPIRDVGLVVRADDIFLDVGIRRFDQ